SIASRCAERRFAHKGEKVGFAVVEKGHPKLGAFKPCDQMRRSGEVNSALDQRLVGCADLGNGEIEDRTGVVELRPLGLGKHEPLAAGAEKRHARVAEQQREAESFGVESHGAVQIVDVDADLADRTKRKVATEGKADRLRHSAQSVARLRGGRARVAPQVGARSQEGARRGGWPPASLLAGSRKLYSGPPARSRAGVEGGREPQRGSMPVRGTDEDSRPTEDNARRPVSPRPAPRAFGCRRRFASRRLRNCPRTQKRIDAPAGIC